MRPKRAREITQFQASGAERLERIACFLESVSGDRLTFARWYGQGRGCAIGLAVAKDPWFLAQGLRLEAEDSLKDCRPTFGSLSDWNAVTEFFGLTPDDARALFSRSGYGDELSPDPARVARKIRQHLLSRAKLAASA